MLDFTYGTLESITNKYESISILDIKNYFKSLKNILINYDPTINDKYNKIKDIIMEPSVKNSDNKHMCHKTNLVKSYTTTDSGIERDKKSYVTKNVERDHIKPINDIEIVNDIISLYKKFSVSYIHEKFYPNLSIKEILKCVDNNKNFVKTMSKNDLIAKLKSYNGSKTVKELADELNYNITYLYDFIKRNNIPYYTIRKPVTIDLLDTIKSYNGSKTLKEMADEFGYSENHIYQVLHKNNISYKKEYKYNKTDRKNNDILNDTANSAKNIINFFVSSFLTKTNNSSDKISIKDMIKLFNEYMNQFNINTYNISDLKMIFKKLRELK